MQQNTGKYPYKLAPDKPDPPEPLSYSHYPVAGLQHPAMSEDIAPPNVMDQESIHSRMATSTTHDFETLSQTPWSNNWGPFLVGQFPSQEYIQSTNQEPPWAQSYQPTAADAFPNLGIYGVAASPEQFQGILGVSTYGAGFPGHNTAVVPVQSSSSDYQNYFNDQETASLSSGLSSPIVQDDNRAINIKRSHKRQEATPPGQVELQFPSLMEYYGKTGKPVPTKLLNVTRNNMGRNKTRCKFEGCGHESTRSAGIYHALHHIDARPHVCDKCHEIQAKPKGFWQQSDLQKHIKKRHKK